MDKNLEIPTREVYTVTVDEDGYITLPLKYANKEFEVYHMQDGSIKLVECQNEVGWDDTE